VGYALAGEKSYVSKAYKILFMVSVDGKTPIIKPP